MEKLLRIFVLVSVLLPAATNATAVEYKVIILHPTWFSDSLAQGVCGGQQVGSATRGTGVPHALLWSGTAESVVALLSSNLTLSRAYDVCGGQQVGEGAGRATGGEIHALVWSGTAESFIDLHPH